MASFSGSCGSSTVPSRALARSSMRSRPSFSSVCRLRKSPATTSVFFAGAIWHCAVMLLQSSSYPVIPRRILVTGGAGYIGSHTVRLLLQQGHDVTVVDNLSRGYRHNVPADRLHELDLADTSALAQLMREKRTDSV